MQELLVILFASAAALFIGRMVYKQFFAKESGCDSCGLGGLDSARPPQNMETD